jgi:hypothetical protein
MSLYSEKYKATPKGKYFSLKEAHIDGSETILVKMDSFGITNTDSQFPCLGTAELDTCTGLALYNTKTKTLVIAHDSEGKNSFFKDALAKVRSNDEDKVECHVIGLNEYPGSKEYTNIRLNKLCEDIAETPNIVLKTFDVGDKPHPSAFIIDSRNGRLIRGSGDIEYDDGITSVYEDHVGDFKVKHEFDGTKPEFSAHKKAKR